LHLRVDEAELLAMKGGKKAFAKVFF